jgi:large subunit ribosomal protein L11
MNKKKDSKQIQAKSHTIRLHIKAAGATPAPPIGPALSQWKVNIMAFCKAFNDQTQALKGSYVPVDIFVKQGGEFTFKVYNKRASDLIRETLGLDKGSKTPGREDFKTISREQLREIARYKSPDLSAADEERAINTLSGTARSMGITVMA